MSKKHFIALADTMKEFLATNAGREMDEITRGVLLEHLCRFCAFENSRFNRGRWLGYIFGDCGPSGGRVKAA